jgi:hypothetical protein
MNAKAHSLAVALLAVASRVMGTPSITSFWLAAEAQTPNDATHYCQAGSFSVSSGALVYFQVSATAHAHFAISGN